MGRSYNVGLGARGVPVDQVHLQEQNKPRNSAQCASYSPWVEARLIGAFRTTSSLHLDVFAANNVTEKFQK